MRADRLIALLLLLQSRGRVTAVEVAAELEVSLATARRDLEALSAAGIPVYAQPGRGGGWRLVGNATTNLSGLSGPQSRALFWLLGTAGLSNPQTRVATMKLIRALPQSLRSEAERLASCVHYDHRAWGGAPGEAADGLELLREAIVNRKVVRATYTARSAAPRERRLRPLGLVCKAGAWYLVADDGRGPRTFRQARLTEAQLTGETFDSPTDFDLVDYWQAHTRDVEALRSGVAATLRVPTWAASILRTQLGHHCTVLNAQAPHAVVEVRAHSLTGLAEQLAGWGDRIDVVSPEALRAELHRIGTELTDHHRSAGHQPATAAGSVTALTCRADPADQRGPEPDEHQSDQH